MHGRFLIAIALVTTALAVGFGQALLLRLAWTLWGVLAVAGILTWSSVRWLQLERTTRANRTEVGGLLEERFQVRNASWLPKLWLEVDDQSELPGHFASRAVATLGPGRSRTWAVRTVCRRRGVFRLGPVHLAGGDPLGIFRAERKLPETASIVVYPRTWPLEGLELPAGYLSGGQVIRRRTDTATSNVRTVRPYRPGDTFSRVHWPTTARRGQLHTKEFELDPLADYWIVLDMDAKVHTGTADDAGDGEPAWHAPGDPTGDQQDLPPTSEEYAVAAAASLARHFLSGGRSVGLISHAQRRIMVQPDRGERQEVKLLGHLAVVRAAGRAALSEVLAAESPAFTRHSTVVVISPTTSLRWLSPLQELKLRGVAAMAVLVEANTFGPGGSADELAGGLEASRIPLRRLRLGDSIPGALIG